MIVGECDECKKTYEIYDLEQIAGSNFIICVDCFNKYIGE